MSDPYGNDPTRRYPAQRGDDDPSQPSRVCPKCGARVPPMTAFCPQCGEDLRPRRSSKAPIWIACLLALLLAAAVVVLIVESGQHNNVTKTVVKPGVTTRHVTTVHQTKTVVRTTPARTIVKTVTVAHTATH